MAEECKSLDGKREHCGCNLTRCHWCGVWPVVVVVG